MGCRDLACLRTLKVTSYSAVKKGAGNLCTITTLKATSYSAVEKGYWELACLCNIDGDFIFSCRKGCWEFAYYYNIEGDLVFSCWKRVLGISVLMQHWRCMQKVKPEFFCVFRLKQKKHNWSCPYVFVCSAKLLQNFGLKKEPNRPPCESILPHFSHQSGLSHDSFYRASLDQPYNENKDVSLGNYSPHVNLHCCLQTMSTSCKCKHYILIKMSSFCDQTTGVLVAEMLYNKTCIWKQYMYILKIMFSCCDQRADVFVAITNKML